MLAQSRNLAVAHRHSLPQTRPVVTRIVGVPCLGVGRRQTAVTVQASTLAPRMPNNNEEGYGQQGGFQPMMGVPNVTMAKGGGGMGSGSSLGATLERSRLNFVMPTPVVQGPKLDDGGSGGDIGKINRNGGGGGGGDDDDDDYFNGEGDDGDGDGEGHRGDGFFRTAIPESYDKFSIGAVMSEWMKTIQELPAILRQAVTMGLFSSAQLVRFFAMDVRPNVTRAISRGLPPSLARDFVGRLMADPGFIQKLVLESSFATAASMWYEFRLRGDKFKQEADLALINSLGMAAATAATVWLLAPSRSYGSIQKFPWQQMLDGLPNCVFDVNGPLRNYTNASRAIGFFAKMAELSAVGAVTGTVTSLLSSAAVAVRQKQNPEWQPSTAVPDVARSSGGLAAFFAIHANTRYQLIGGLDRFLFDRTNFLWTYVALSGAARLLSNQVGEVSRPFWQGLPDPATLSNPVTMPAAPQPRKIKKKVSKRVPRQKPAAQAVAADATQEQLESVGLAATAASMAAAPLLLDTAVPLEATTILPEQPVQQQLDVSPVSGEQLQGIQTAPAVDGMAQSASSSPDQSEQLSMYQQPLSVDVPQQQYHTPQQQSYDSSSNLAPHYASSGSNQLQRA